MITAPPTLVTDRLILRPQQASDYEACVAMWNDEAVVRHIGGATRPAQDVWFNLARSRGMWPLIGYGYWIAVEKGSQRFVGEVGFSDFKRGMNPDLSAWPEAGWAFNRDSWGKGYASEAVGAIHDWLDENCPGPSNCIIDAGNIASRRVAEKSGYDFWCEALYRDNPVNVYRREGVTAT
jgi:RimJ/RimL family protein N-acetyltransferase